MLVWLKNPVTIENNTEEEVATFVDNYVTCSLPPESDERALLLQVQRHTHSGACRKHGQSCRFHFPKPPLQKTEVFTPPQESPSQQLQTRYKESLQAIHDQLAQLDHNSETSLESILDQVGITQDVYLDALRWTKTQHGQPAVLLQRSPQELNVNNYNRTMMLAWEANLDIQFVTNTYACVLYVASYISKPEKTLGDVLKAVSDSAQHLGPKTAMKSVAKKFLSHREVSAQEAVYRVLSLPLTKSSRQVIFIPTNLPENRTRLFKPLRVIETMDDDDPDVFMVCALLLLVFISILLYLYQHTSAAYFILYYV